MNWYTLSPNFPWLTLVLVLPLAGALLVSLVPSVARRTVKQLGILSSIATLLLVGVLIGGFQQGLGNLRFQFEEIRQWIPSVGISYHLGLDGLSLFLLGRLPTFNTHRFRTVKCYLRQPRMFTFLYNR